MDKIQKDSIEFIHNELIPEMIHNRCFCECGSREFVEFHSVVVKPLEKYELRDDREFYRAHVRVKFSGVPKVFCVIIKLLPYDIDSHGYSYGRFLNEEIFYNKMIAEYQLNIFPKCYVADMGRYGRPVIVLEDLEAIGYSRNSGLLDDDHMKLCLTAIAEFHARGMTLKREKFEKFREFYAKIIEITSREDANAPQLKETLKQAFQDILKLSDETTMIHGKYDSNHLVFYYDNCKPVAIKVTGWNEMKYTLPTVDLESIVNSSAIIKLMGHDGDADSIGSIKCIEGFVDLYRAVYTRELNSNNEKNHR